MDLKAQLIRLGNTKPELRKDLKPVIAHLDKQAATYTLYTASHGVYIGRSLVSGVSLAVIEQTARETARMTEDIAKYMRSTGVAADTGDTLIEVRGKDLAVMTHLQNFQPDMLPDVVSLLARRFKVKGPVRL